jgi:hypothetical protein
MTFDELAPLVMHWRQFSFNDALGLSRGHVAERACDAVARAFDELGIAERVIAGENFKGLSAAEAGNPLTLFSTAFNDTVLNPSAHDRTPAAYVARWVERHDDYSDPRVLTGYIARALRAMPSFLREEALAGDLRLLLCAAGVDALVIRDPNEDYSNHTDILVKVSSRTYRIWTFVFSEQSFNRTAMKLTGRLPAGIHVLCPLELEQFGRIETTYLSIEKRRKALATLEYALESTADVRARRGLAKRIQGRQATLSALAARHDSLKLEFADRVRFISGFFFYPVSTSQHLATLVASPGFSIDRHDVPRAKVFDLLGYLRRLNAFEVDHTDAASS